MTTPVFTQAVDPDLSKVSIQIVLPSDKETKRYVFLWISKTFVPRDTCLFLINKCIYLIGVKIYGYRVTV